MPSGEPCHRYFSPTIHNEQLVYVIESIVLRGKCQVTFQKGISRAWPFTSHDLTWDDLTQDHQVR